MLGYLGIDIGSTTVKVVLLDRDCNHLTEPLYTRSLGQPLAELLKILQYVKSLYQKDVVVGVTGSGREVVADRLNLEKQQSISEIYAHARGAWHVSTGVRTIIDIGGQDNKLIRLKPDGNSKFVISDFVMNELCAAGTGSFLEMHAKELGYASIEEFSHSAFRALRASKIAGRCSVLAQSDVVHLRQGGEDLDHIAAGLCRAVVLNALAMAGGKRLRPPILFQGGVASNEGVVKALKAELSVKTGQLIVPAYHKTVGAIGCALNVAGLKVKPKSHQLEELVAVLSHSSHDDGKLKPKKILIPLKGYQGKNSASLIIAKPPNGSQEVPNDTVLGIDIGSASVKCAALDMKGNCLFTFYRLHNGKVADALYQGLAALENEISNPSVKVVSVTGSGREHIKLRIGADFNIDEISALAAGAQKLTPNIDTIFEIGGQDSKYIRIRDGHVVDFEMNKICAAGTGAFILESAKILGIGPGKTIDQLAFESESPQILNNRCCVFAKSDMVSLLNSGASKADIAAGIAYTVMKNYLNLVVGNHDPGTKIAFLGGVAKSSLAVRAALKQLKPDFEIDVPDMCEVSGALGAAQIALEKFKKHNTFKTRFNGFAPTAINEPVKEFDCNRCANLCRIKKWEMVDENPAFTGSICGRFDEGQAASAKRFNYVDADLELIQTYEGESCPITDDVIGIPKALLYFEQGPLWVTFLRELGLKVVISDTGRDAVKKGSMCTTGQVCLPIKVLLGHCADMVEKGVKKIFYPTVVEMDRPANAIRSDNCMVVQASADSFLKSAFSQIELISPVFHYDGRHPKWHASLCEAGMNLGFNRSAAESAVEKAVAVQKEFIQKRAELGKRFLNNFERNIPSVVLFAHEYSCASELDMGVSRHFAKLGVNVAPLSIILPLAKEEKLGSQYSDLIFKSSQNTIRAMIFLKKQKPNFFAVVLNQFLCRQDACVIPFLQKVLQNRPFLRLVLDENTGDAGLKTRCEAFCHVMKNQLGSLNPTAFIPSLGFIPEKKLKNFDGVIWVNKLLRFYAAGYDAVGIKVKFLPVATRETIDKGRKYFPDGEPCLPFIREAGQLEELLRQTEFNPHKDVIHVPGTRHCTSTTLPQIYKRVCENFGAEKIRFVSPRDGLDAAEGVEAFGTKYIQTIIRAMFAEDYLRRMHLSTRPYEAIENETDSVLSDCLEQLYTSFTKGDGYFKLIKTLAEQLHGVRTNGQKGTRPKILVSGEYVVRTDAYLNGNIHKQIELLGAEAVRTPLFNDYAEYAGKSRYKSLWKLGFRLKSARELILSQFLKSDIMRIRSVFAPYLQGRIEPDPREFFNQCRVHIDNRLDPVLLLEFYQALWNMECGDIAGIVIVHPFGCSISTAIEPAIHRVFGAQVPILSLSFDGQANVHMFNRLEALMECVHAGFRRKC